MKKEAPQKASISLENKAITMEKIDALEICLASLLKALGSSDPEEIMLASQNLQQSAETFGMTKKSKIPLSEFTSTTNKKLAQLRWQLNQARIITQTAYNYNESFLSILVAGGSGLLQKTYTQQGLVKVSSSSNSITRA